jgi:hypothetical protein
MKAYNNEGSYSAAPHETGVNMDMAVPDMASDMILASWVGCQLL